MMAQEYGQQDQQDEARYEDSIDEFAPAQVHREDVGTSYREQLPVCKSCWTTMSEPETCRACGRPQNISDIDWYRIVYGWARCSRCGHDIPPEAEGFCDECGSMDVEAAA